MRIIQVPVDGKLNKKLVRFKEKNNLAFSDIARVALDKFLSGDLTEPTEKRSYDDTKEEAHMKPEPVSEPISHAHIEEPKAPTAQELNQRNHMKEDYPPWTEMYPKAITEKEVKDKVEEWKRGPAIQKEERPFFTREGHAKMIAYLSTEPLRKREEPKT